MEYRSVTEAQAICESLPGGALTKISSREHRDVLAALVQKVYVLEYFKTHIKTIPQYFMM